MRFGDNRGLVADDENKLPDTADDEDEEAELCIDDDDDDDDNWRILVAAAQHAAVDGEGAIFIFTLANTNLAQVR